MRNQRIFAMIGIGIIALLLAFPLRDAVFRGVVIPLSYGFWALGLVYRAVHQGVWWTLALFLVLYLLVRSIWPKIKVKEKFYLRRKPVVGQVENLTDWLKKSERGVYFKWLVANRLGKIANRILENRSSGKQRSFFDPLTGPDWTPDPRVQTYLETGLHRSFVDYPQKNRFFSRPVKTPMDHDVNDVIQYLESQIENK